MTKRAHNEGSVYKRSRDGRWVGALSLGWEGDKVKRKYVYADTQGEAVKALEKLKRSIAAGRPPAPGRLTVGQLLDEWLANRMGGQVKPKTHERAAINIRAHLKPAFSHVRVKDLTAGMIQEMLNRKTAAGLSPRTVKMIRQTLSQALTWAASPGYGYIPDNVARYTVTPKIPKRRVTPTSPADGAAILQAVAEHRIASAFVVDATTGLRQGELLGLRWGDVDLDAAVANVSMALHREAGVYLLREPKSEESRAAIPLPSIAVDAIRARRTQQLEEQLAAGPLWSGNPLGLIWTTPTGEPIYGPALTRQFQALLAKAGIPRMRMHDLRHACATMLLSQGVPLEIVQRVLRHATISVTGDIYGHLLPELLRSAADSMDRALSGARQNPIAVKAAGER